jgi:hypothetical protein
MTLKLTTACSPGRVRTLSILKRKASNISESSGIKSWRGMLSARVLPCVGKTSCSHATCFPCSILLARRHARKQETDFLPQYTLQATTLASRSIDIISSQGFFDMFHPRTSTEVIYKPATIAIVWWKLLVVQFRSRNLQVCWLCQQVRADYA